MAPLRVLFLADSHLGLDLPARPRVERRRRGDDFFANFERALAPALAGEADLVVHGGDLLYRSRVGAALVERAVRPLRRVADRGVPVVLVPGNHERSSLPYPILAAHDRIHLLDRPRTVRVEAAGVAVALAGFPFVRDDVRGRFPELVAATGWRTVAAEVRLLCLHQAVEGARVGPADFVFRDGADVVRGADLPAGFAAVLAGHIHRHQVLERDLGGRPLPAPVLYPGSIERTSFAERRERKGYLMVEIEPGPGGGRLRRAELRPLATRPMVEVVVEPTGLAAAEVERRLLALFARVPADALLRLRLVAPPGDGAAELFGAARLRRLAPATMTVSVVAARGRGWQSAAGVRTMGR